MTERHLPYAEQKRLVRERAGRLIRAARERAGLSVAEVEQRLGMGPTAFGESYLEQVEAGRMLLVQRYAVPLCDLLGLDPAQMPRGWYRERGERRP